MYISELILTSNKKHMFPFLDSMSVLTNGILNIVQQLIKIV